MNSPNSLEPLSRKELTLILLLACIQFTNIVDFMILMPLGPQLMRIFSIGPTEFGFLVAVYNFGSGVSGFLGSFFLDRIDRRKALLTAYFGFIIGTFGCAIASQFEFLLLSRAVAGVFGGVLGAVVMSIVSDQIPLKKRGRAMGLVMASFSAASVLGVPLGLFLAQTFNWHAPFSFLVFASIALIAWSATVLRPMREHISQVAPKGLNVHASLKRVARDPTQRLALILTVFLTLGHFLLIPFISPSLVANAEFPESSLPLIYLVGGGLTIFTSPWVGRLSDLIGRKVIFATASLSLLLPLYLITHWSKSPLFLTLSVTGLFFVASNARYVPAYTLITSAVTPEHRGSFLSLNQSVQSMAGALSSLIASFVVARGASGRLENFDQLGWLAMGLTVIALFIGLKLNPKERAN